MSEATDQRAQSPLAGSDGIAKLTGLRAKKARSLWSDAFRQYRRHHLAMASTVILSVIVLATIFGYPLWGHSYASFSFADQYKSPSLAHPMGTDTWATTDLRASSGAVVCPSRSASCPRSSRLSLARS
jgi:peptide/nickel transport system permease protein